MNADRWKQIDELFDAVLDLPETDGAGIPPLRTIADVTVAVESFLRQPNGVAAHAPPAPSSH